MQNCTHRELICFLSSSNPSILGEVNPLFIGAILNGGVQKKCKHLMNKVLILHSGCVKLNCDLLDWIETHCNAVELFPSLGWKLKDQADMFVWQ